MLKQITIIKNKLGLHARPAMGFASTAATFRCAVRVRRHDGTEWVDGKSVMQMLMLACTHGTTIEVQTDGPDERDALDTLMRLIDSRFEEE